MRIDCPFPEWNGVWIELPDKWLGAHANKRDEALEAAQKARLRNTQLDFAVALSLLENWHIPHLGGNPQEWDFAKLNLELIAWIAATVLASYQACFVIPKKNWRPSPEPPAVTPTAGAVGREMPIV
jgi:hypothetical protein